MSIYLKLFGGGLLLLGVFFSSSEYSAFADRRLLHYASIIALLSHAKGRISRYLSSGEEMWRDFENNELEKIGLLPDLREGACLSRAFERCENRLALPKETKDRIKKFLFGVGREYRAGVVDSFGDFLKRLEAEMENERLRLEKSVKVTRALLIGGALAFIILII